MDCDLLILTCLLVLEGEVEEEDEPEDENEAFKDTGREIEEVVLLLRLIFGDGGRTLRLVVVVVAIFFGKLLWSFCS